MYAHIAPENGEAMEIEFESRCPDTVSEPRRTIKDGICERTATSPERNNAASYLESDGMQSRPKDAEKLCIAHDDDLERPDEKGLQASMIYVSRVDKWTEYDIQKPENRVAMRDIIQDAGACTRTWYEELIHPRTVEASMLDGFPGLRDSMMRDAPLQDFLRVVPTSSPTEVTRRELRCYEEVYDENAEGVSHFQSRAFDTARMHTLFIASMLMYPSFLRCERPVLKRLQLVAERTSGLRMIIKSDDVVKTHRLAPESNMAVIDKTSGLPVLICDVDFRGSKTFAGMILQGVVACRQWRYILPDSLKERNRVLGLFVDENFVAEVCLFHADGNYSVEIFRKIFCLERTHESLHLLRILFNHRDTILDIAGQSEKTKLEALMNIVSPPRKTSPASIKNTPEPTENRTHSFLLSSRCKSLFCPDGAVLQGTKNERVAAVKTLGNSHKTIGFVKVTNKHELRAFDTIRQSGCEFLLSRVILPTKVIEISGSPIIFLPFGGDPLEYTWGNDDGPIGHEVEIAWDLLTIVSHLHELNIAHLDIKPSNILWDASTQSIRIIDFDSSEVLDPTRSRKVEGVYGTTGFAAPEAESEEDIEFDPFLADAFSCGEVIWYVVSADEMSEEQEFLLDISTQMSKENVEERLSIGKAMQVWREWLRERGQPVHE